MIFQKSQPVETRHKCLSSASTGPLKNMDTSSLAPKARVHKYTKKLAVCRTLENFYGPYGII
jgi:hypothetical protein